jgi:hypothetical protein
MAILAIAASALTVLGVGSSFAAAHAATPVATTVTAVTNITNRPDTGHGTPAVWAYDKLQRTLTVTKAADQSTAPTGDTLYSATITDVGGFNTVGGAGTPSQAVAGLTILHNGVKGSVNGTYALSVTAPTADTLTGVVPATENDNFAAPAVTTTNWPKLAFASSTGVTVTGGAYEWDYATACEKWVDSSVNGDGNLAGDGNITGKICDIAFVYNGHVVSVTPHSGVVGWDESAKGWPSDNHCVQVYIYGFDTPKGTAHIGFTCDHGNRAADLGYLRNLAAGHSVSMFVRPAEGVYGNNHPLPGTDANAHIFLVTPAK